MFMVTQEISATHSVRHGENEAETKRLSTIVIDDSPSFLDIVCALLERENQVDVVARGKDGVEAIDIVAKLRPDLALMDIEMPHLDGLTAALIISTRFPETRVLLMSAEESGELRAFCHACGAAGFIHKDRFRDQFPFAIERMMQRPTTAD